MFPLRDFAIAILRTLRRQGFKAYLVGGCVRDLLLGRQPADYDVATDATPEQVMSIFPETYAVGAQFGVVLVPLQELSSRSLAEGASSEKSLKQDPEHRAPAPAKDQVPDDASAQASAVEVATFRSDIGYSDGRHPDEVRFSKDPHEDVGRRDFTINAMLLDPLAGKVEDQILDFVGGRRDLESRIIRSMGEPELRFAEDKLRMLRAVRFAARFEYTIETATFAAIQKLAPAIQQVSRERVRDELTKMLTEGHARIAFLLLDATGLLREVLPEIAAMKGVAQPPQFHPEGDVFVHTLRVLENLPHPCPAVLAWGALLHDVGKPATFRVAPDRIRFDGHVEVGVRMAEEVGRRLRFSGDQIEQVVALVKHHMRFGQAPLMNQSTLKKFLRLPDFDQHMALHRADCSASHGDLSAHRFVQEKLAEIPQREMRPARLVTGEDLIAAGYLPGPRFRRILDAVEDAQLEGRVVSRESAIEFVRGEFPMHEGDQCNS